MTTIDQMHAEKIGDLDLRSNDWIPNTPLKQPYAF